MRSTSRRFFSCASGRGAYDRIRLKKHPAPNKLRAAGQVAEWLKAPVSKTGIPVNPVSRVRISPCPLRIPSVLLTEPGCPQSVGEWLALAGSETMLGRVAEWFKAHA